MVVPTHVRFEGLSMSQCNLLFVDYTPCKHELLVTHVKEGVEITCKHCNSFTVYTSRKDVARVAGIFGRK